ncbi:hypothetical protein Zmor_015792 [Zophobas morio]|uniref:Uncharacterized protein n=1 Tax=Zophobas morio TaxID=2755281 RepID=A0AA38IMR3_9CUCU|nr:hypothetical protein Zmor_015792 [Zophobas morio]
MAVEENLLLLEDDQFRIRLHCCEGHSDVTKEMFKVGDVILVANMAGRKTNVKINRVGKEKSVLRVIVGFLPCSLRVEGQTVERISRQSHNGTV